MRGCGNRNFALVDSLRGLGVVDRVTWLGAVGGLGWLCPVGRLNRIIWLGAVSRLILLDRVSAFGGVSARDHVVASQPPHHAPALGHRWADRPSDGPDQVAALDSLRA